MAAEGVGEAEFPAACPLVQCARLPRSAMQADSEVAEAGVRRVTLLPAALAERFGASAVCMEISLFAHQTLCASAGIGARQCTCRAALHCFPGSFSTQ